MRFSRITIASSLALCLLVSAPRARGQSSGTTTGDLKGRVVDDKSIALPGVTVSATNRDTGLARQTVSKLDGEYVIPLLTPGIYLVKAEVSLFNPAQFENVRVTLGTTTNLDIPLATAQSTTAIIEVTAETGLIDSGKTDLSATIDQKKIDSLPNVDRDFISFSFTTPRVSKDRNPGNTGAASSSGISINGQSPRLNNVVVDGFDNNDQATGSVRATFSQDAIQEYQVITNPYASEFGRTAGGVINIITRSGSNDVKGSAFYFYRADSLASKDPLTGEKVPLKDNRFGASLGGPLMKDKTFFYAAYERQSKDTANAVTIADADIALIRSQGFAIENGNVPYQVRNDNFVLKLDHQFSPSNFFTVRGNWSKGKDENQQNWGGLVAKSAGGARDSRDISGALSLTSILGGTSFNELRGLYSNASYAVNPLDSGYGISVQMAGVAEFGTQRFLPQPRDSRVYQIFDAFTFEPTPKVRIKIGAEFDRFDLEGALPIFFAGQARFQALSATLTTRAAFASGTPAAFIQAFGDPNGKDHAQQISGFLQSDFTLSSNFLVRVGARYDYEQPIAPFPTDSNNISPRLSFSWSLGDSVRFKGGYGRFFGVAALGPMFAVSIQDGVRVRTQVRTILGGPSPVVPWRTYPDHRFPNEAAAGASIVPPTLLRPGAYESAYTDQASFGGEFTLGRKLLASLDGVYSRGRRILVARNVNPRVPGTGVPANPRPDPRFGDVFQYESTGNSWYTGGTLGLITRLGGPFEFTAFYTRARAEDDYIDWLTEFQAQDPLNPGDERAPSTQSPDQTFTMTATYSTVGRNLNAFARDWTFSTILDWRNGIHYNVTAGFDRNANGDPISDRPVGVGRNAGSLGAQFTLDLRLSRTISFSKEVGLELIAVCTNVTNQENVLQKNGVAYLTTTLVPNPNFDQPTLYGPGRLFQIGARLNF
ncbi:MAG: TonB-dependent receptor [Thermoanaerobaculia bacterium]